MPTYQYRCRDCGEELEVVQSFSDKPKTKCPACKGSLRKVFAAPGISFKGSGFYKNDSRGGSSSSSSSSSSTSEAKAGRSSDGEAGKKDTAKSDTTKGSKESSGSKAAAGSAT